jgi:hypothetical protein
MQSEHLRFGGGVDQSILHPAVFIAMLVAILLIWFLPRKYVIVPLLVSTFLIPLGQQVVIGGLHFFVFRIIILAAALRILLSALSSPEGAFGSGLELFDKIFLLWALCRAFAVILLFMQFGAVVNQVGFLLDALGGYFALRYSIRDEQEIYRAIRVFAALVIVIGGFMVFEKLRLVNAFGLLGGVTSVPEIREGSVRAQGPFQHEILAGTFAATLLPLFYILWKNGKLRIFACLGIVGATMMAVSSASSTPIVAFGAAIVGICLWPLRNYMQVVRWSVVCVLVTLHLVMKAPVWFLIQRVDVVGGSSGYHRAMLVDNFIRHFSDWWLIGTKDNPTWGLSMWDLLNQFVAEGQTGGLVTLALFIAMIYICFSRIGTARKTVEGNTEREWYFWLFGVALFSHIVAFFGATYFDHIRISWFALQVMILVASASYLPAKETAPSRIPAASLPAQTNYATRLPKTSFNVRPGKNQAHFRPRFS